MVAMRGLSRCSWCAGPWLGGRTSGGVLVCWGPDSWSERSPDRGAEPEKVGGLKMRTDADSRLLSSSAFWEGDKTQVRR